MTAVTAVGAFTTHHSTLTTATPQSHIHMATFELSKKIRTAKPLDAQTIKDFVRQKLGNSCKFESTGETQQALSIKGRVKETLFTPVTRFTSTLEVKTDADTARVSFNGKSSPNLIFWLFFVIGLFTGVFLVVAIGLFLLQRNKPQETCQGILNAIETEFGSI